MKTIIYTVTAAKELEALGREARQQVEAGIEAYAMTGRGDVKALAGQDGYRLRIGRYRVVFDEDTNTVLALYVGKRETTTYKRR